jgi:DNA-binding IclR family transcriptional regulator
LVVIEDGRAVSLAQASPPLPVALFTKPGSSANIMESSSGYVILAHQEPEKRERALADWRRNNPHQKIPRDLDRHLQRIRNKGYELVNSYQVQGIINISFPILDARGSALAAVTSPYIQRQRDTTTTAETVRLLRHCARAIAAGIGSGTEFG